MWGRMASCRGLVIRLVLAPELLTADCQSTAGYQPAPQLLRTRLNKITKSSRRNMKSLWPVMFPWLDPNRPGGLS